MTSDDISRRQERRQILDMFFSMGVTGAAYRAGVYTHVLVTCGPSSGEQLLVQSFTICPLLTSQHVWHTLSLSLRTEVLRMVIDAYILRQHRLAHRCMLDAISS